MKTPLAYLLVGLILLHGILFVSGVKPERKKCKILEQMIPENSDYKISGEILFKLMDFKEFSQRNGAMVRSDSVFFNGIPWEIEIKNHGHLLGFHLCIAENNVKDIAWSCEVEYKLSAASYSKSHNFSSEDLDSYYSCAGDEQFATFEQLLDTKNGVYDEKENAVTFKVEMLTKKPKRFRRFRAEDTLLVNGQLVFVNKYLLSAHSNDFKKLFFGEDAKKCPIIYNESDNAVENFKQLNAIINSPDDGAELDDASIESLSLMVKKLNMNSAEIYKSHDKIQFILYEFKAFVNGDKTTKRISEKKLIAGIIWRIEIEHDGTHIVFKLCCDADEFVNDGIVYFFAYELCATSFTNVNNCVIQRGNLNEMEFCELDYCYGFMEFTKISQVFDPINGVYDRNRDTVTFTAEVRTDHHPYRIRNLPAEDKLWVNEQEVNVNKYLLAAQSDFFENLFFVEKKSEIEIVGIENAVEKFKQLIYSVNSPSAVMEEDWIENILELATHFHMGPVENSWFNFLMNYSNIHSKIAKLQLAHRYGVTAMKMKILDEFKKLPYDCKKNFLDLLLLSQMDEALKQEMIKSLE